MSDDKSTPILRLKSISKSEFDENFLNKGIPVVIEKATDHWPAREWTLDSLVEKAGDNKVYVRWNTSSKEYKLGTKYNIRETTFGQYINDLKDDNHKAKKSYLAVQNIKKALPQLQDDVEVPEYIGKLHGGPYLWIAHQGHYEYCHFDPDDGMLVMLQGRKHVRLYGCDPDPLYPNPLGSKGRTVQSRVDSDNPDLDAYPLYRDVVCQSCTLQPGEMLYIPAFWWHQVTSIDLCISINMFWGDAGINTYLTKVMHPPRWKAFSHWLLNIIEQNRQCGSFVKMLSRLPEALHHFLVNQWHEQASQEQLGVLVKLVMDYLNITELPNQPNKGNMPTALVIRGLLWRS